ncbi:hybrid sensor histidine kinase/response regulator [Salidesulfovibrio onnuriiensis]|uniref:hybrid sensor histidine kinase/response regulator n=1 Tax=Salidesulfovibrio onnuriiensis TaxID=2583823 RepID=UPI0011C7DBAD|nr:hybrid sensor histidine kinase/response regulator [Salidesulfovibrio onnuriiensis]
MAHQEEAERPVILIVEDSKTVQQELARQLTASEEFRAETASTFAEARQYMDARASEVFVAILDITLPDAADGEVVDYACKLGVPSIVFTSNLDEYVRRKILSRNIIDYVVKDNLGVPTLVNQVHRLRRNQAIKVMVVDDSTSFRNFLRHQLELQMFQVVEAPNGERALELYGQEPDVSMVIVDYEMPGMNGLEVTRALRRKSGPVDLAIIGVSARDNSPLSAWFVKSGANDFLHKPFMQEEFNCRVLQNVEILELVRALRKHDQERTKFLGIVAHDLRTPINGISGFVNLVLDDGGNLTDDQRELLDIVGTAANNMLGMVNDLLDISVIHSGKLDLRIRSFDLGQLILERVRIQNMVAAGKNIVIKAEFEKVPPVSGDAARIAQMVDNLLSNAVKYSPLGSEPVVSMRRDGQDVHVVVRDQGPGIAAKDQKKIFRSFARTSAMPTGNESSVGLGLMIVRNIVEAHRGRVWVKSEPGQGAAFHVSLPMVHAEGEKN